MYRFVAVTKILKSLFMKFNILVVNVYGNPKGQEYAWTLENYQNWNIYTMRY